MAVKIRLARGGSKQNPYYRIVVADSRCPRDGRFIERVGSYNPMLPQDRADRVVLNEDRIRYWLSVGAQPTDRVALFLSKAQLGEAPVRHEKPQKSAPKAKAQERLKERADKAKAVAEAAAQAAAAPAPEPTPEPAPEAEPETPVAEAPAEVVEAAAPAEAEAPAEEQQVEA